MDIKSLLHLGCAKVASLIKGRFGSVCTSCLPIMCLPILYCGLRVFCCTHSLTYLYAGQPLEKIKDILAQGTKSEKKEEKKKEKRNSA